MNFLLELFWIIALSSLMAVWIMLLRPVPVIREYTLGDHELDWNYKEVSWTLVMIPLDGSEDSKELEKLIRLMSLLSFNK